MTQWTQDKPAAGTDVGTAVWRRTATDGGRWALQWTRRGYVLSFNDEVADSGRGGTYRFRTWSDAARHADNADDVRG